MCLSTWFYILCKCGAIFYSVDKINSLILFYISALRDCCGWFPTIGKTHSALYWSTLITYLACSKNLSGLVWQYFVFYVTKLVFSLPQKYVRFNILKTLSLFYSPLSPCALSEYCNSLFTCFSQKSINQLQIGQQSIARLGIKLNPCVSEMRLKTRAFAVRAPKLGKYPPEDIIFAVSNLFLNLFLKHTFIRKLSQVLFNCLVGNYVMIFYYFMLYFIYLIVCILFITTLVFLFFFYCL